MDADRRKRFLGAMTTPELRRMHWLVSRELAARGEEVRMMVRHEPPVREYGELGYPRRSTKLPGLRRAMLEAGVASASELARRARVSSATVGRALAGECRTHTATAREMAKALGVSLEELRTPPPTFGYLSPPPTASGGERDHERRGAA